MKTNFSLTVFFSFIISIFFIDEAGHCMLINKGKYNRIKNHQSQFEELEDLHFINTQEEEEFKINSEPPTANEDTPSQAEIEPEISDLPPLTRTHVILNMEDGPRLSLNNNGKTKQSVDEAHVEPRYSVGESKPEVDQYTGPSLKFGGVSEPKVTKISQESQELLKAEIANDLVDLTIIEDQVGGQLGLAGLAGCKITKKDLEKIHQKTQEKIKHNADEKSVIDGHVYSPSLSVLSQSRPMEEQLEDVPVSDINNHLFWFTSNVGEAKEAMNQIIKKLKSRGITPCRSLTRDLDSQIRKINNCEEKLGGTTEKLQSYDSMLDVFKPAVRLWNEKILKKSPKDSFRNSIYTANEEFNKAYTIIDQCLSDIVERYGDDDDFKEEIRLIKLFRRENSTIRAEICSLYAKKDEFCDKIGEASSSSTRSQQLLINENETSSVYYSERDFMGCKPDFFDEINKKPTIDRVDAMNEMARKEVVRRFRQAPSNTLLPTPSEVETTKVVGDYSNIDDTILARGSAQDCSFIRDVINHPNSKKRFSKKVIIQGMVNDIQRYYNREKGKKLDKKVKLEDSKGSNYSIHRKVWKMERESRAHGASKQDIYKIDEAMKGPIKEFARSNATNEDLKYIKALSDYPVVGSSHQAIGNLEGARLFFGRLTKVLHKVITNSKETYTRIEIQKLINRSNPDPS